MKEQKKDPTDKAIVYIDSSFLRHISPHTPLVSRLRELVKEGKAEVRIPWLVQQEAETGIAEDLSQSVDLRALRSGISWILQSPESSVQKDLSEVLTTLVKDAQSLISAGMKHWINQLGAVVTSPTVDIGRAFGRYFKGQPPFRSMKNRSDIPDGFIFEEVAAFAEKQTKQLHFLTMDKGLKDALEKHQLVIVGDNLAEFLSLIDRPLEEWKTHLQQFCGSHEEEIIKKLGDKLGDSLVGEPVYADWLPSDNQDGTVSLFGEAENVRVLFEEAEALGPRLAVVPIEFDCNGCFIDLFVHKGDYANLSDDEAEKYSTEDPDWNERYMLLQTQVDLTARAEVAVLLEGKTGSEVIKQTSVEEVEEVEIKDANSK